MKPKKHETKLFENIFCTQDLEVSTSFQRITEITTFIEKFLEDVQTNVVAEAEKHFDEHIALFDVYLLGGCAFSGQDPEMADDLSISLFRSGEPIIEFGSLKEALKEFADDYRDDHGDHLKGEIQKLRAVGEYALSLAAELEQQQGKRVSTGL